MRLAGLLAAAGWVLLTVAAALISVPAGFAVAGVGCLMVARQVG